MSAMRTRPIMPTFVISTFNPTLRLLRKSQLLPCEFAFNIASLIINVTTILIASQAVYIHFYPLIHTHICESIIFFFFRINILIFHL